MAFAQRDLLICLACSALVTTGAMAGEHGNRDEAVAMTKKAVAQIKAAGADKTYADITAQVPAFHDRDLYVVVYDQTGKCLAHGSKTNLVGKDMSGAAYVQERMKLMAANTSFWQDYNFVDPVTNKVEPKSTYCETLNNTAVCVGYYKPPAK